MFLAPMRAVIVACLVIACALSACGPAAEASLTRSAWPVTLAGTTWTAIRVGDVPTVAGSQPTAAFTTDQVKGSTGCNSYFGSYEYSRGAIKFSTMGSTAMACLDPAIEATKGPSWAPCRARRRSRSIRRDG